MKSCISGSVGIDYFSKVENYPNAYQEEKRWIVEKSVDVNFVLKKSNVETDVDGTIPII